MHALTTNCVAGTDNRRIPTPRFSNDSDERGVVEGPRLSKDSDECGVKSTSHPSYTDSIQSTNAREAGMF